MKRETLLPKENSLQEYYKDVKLDKDCLIRAIIWDTDGEEQGWTKNEEYFKNAKGVLLVYDVTNLKSL